MFSWMSVSKAFFLLCLGRAVLRDSGISLVSSHISFVRSMNYSRLSLSPLSRITAYLEVKIWSLPKHENLITSNKILWKRGEIAPKEGAISSLFHNIFNISLTSKVQLHIALLNAVVRFMFFLKSANLICRSTDNSKYFRESLGTWDNENRLYI